MKKILKLFRHAKSKERAKLRALQITLAVLVGLLLALGFVYWQAGQDAARVQDLKQQAASFSPDQPVPPPTAKIGGPFTLTDMNGKTVHDTDFRGKYLLIYFGYTYCPDMCPTGLQSIAKTMDLLGDKAGKVQPLFITIDPARDTAAKMKDYCASFHPSIVGLTGTAEQTAAIAKEYEVYYARGEQVDEDDYIMDHSSLIYVMDDQGRFITTANENVDPAHLVDVLKKAWGESK